VFLVNSRLSPFPATPSPHVDDVQLLGHPFFQRYGVNLPSSLTEVRSCTWGAIPQPTSVGLRYGQNGAWLAAFLDGLGTGDFRPLAGTRPSRHAHHTGISLGVALRTGSPACPFAGFTLLTASPLRS
jgi:hypothetical protein